MKKIRSPGESYRDISEEEVFFYPLVALVVIVLLVAFCLIIFALTTAATNGDVAAYNERAAEFNAKPWSERKIIAEWTENAENDPETLLITPKEKQSLFLLTYIHGRGNVIKEIPYYLLVVLLILSVWVFYSYWRKKDSRYYLYSLPYDRPYGWVLFFCMFVGWPFMLGSFICARVQYSEYYREQHDRRQAERERKRIAKKNEEAEVWRLAEEELAEMARDLTKPAFPEVARRALKAYVIKGQARAHRARLKEALQKVDEAQTRLQKAGEQVRVAQQKLGQARAETERLQSVNLEESGHERAEADWLAIRNTRGISSIRYNRARKRLEIVIKVRVPYKGELYDFGDYRLCIDGSSNCNCKEIRSGVRLDHSSLAPLYHIHGKHFCFGSSLSTIEEYLGDGRYVEAITLIVECMHSVNDEHDAERIPDCFRKVCAVEKAKRRILRNNKILEKVR